MHSFVFALLILKVVDILNAVKTESVRVTEGDTFVLRCTTNLQYPVVWHFQHSHGTHEIFMGGEIAKSFKNMLNITGNQSLGEYNLLIPSADGRYVGNYSCIDDDGLGSELRSIQLNIIASTTTRSTYVLFEPIDTPGLDAEDYKSPAAAANSLQEAGQPSSNVAAEVYGPVVGIVVLATIIIIIIAVRRKPKCPAKSKGKQGASYPKGSLSLHANVSDSSATSKATKNLDSLAIPASEKECEKDTSFLPDSIQPYTYVSQSSDSSGGSGSSDDPLIRPGKEEHV